MSGASGVLPLHGNQRLAVDPAETVWLSASAGTGKTQVLSSRVLRLLLQPGVAPSQILCLTFTKAGATEMAARINATLATWVRLDDADLFHHLEAIGAPSGPEARARARTLFAAVLECPGGGLRIDTIHAFSQWLLAAFPQEAGLLAGARPMEDRERVILARKVLADLLVSAENDPLGDPQVLGAVADLSLRLGPDAVEKFLLRCAGAHEVWFGPGSWQAPDIPRHLRRLLGLPEDADGDWLAAMCADTALDTASLRRCMDANAAWGTSTGLAAVDAISEWLLGTPAQRIETLDTLAAAFLTQQDTPRSPRYLLKHDEDYPEYQARVIAAILEVKTARALLALAEGLVAPLRLGRAFAIAWDEAKAREGLIDFDDQIRRAAALLARAEQAEWIRYKLDRRFDHILVDEAQDTNAAQWEIILKLAEEFWAGLGARGEVLRTLFVVGDYKQAIFRFQGTSPENFRHAADRVRERMDAAADNAGDLRGEPDLPRLRDLGLDRSFRTAREVLGFVDAAIAGIGHEAFGLARAADPHEGQERPGYVALWQPVGLATGETDGDAAGDAGTGDAGAGEDDGEGEEGWLSRPDRRMADNIARQVAAWLDPAGPGFWLHKQERRAHAGDVMVLVRKRRELAALIVGRLHAAGVKVAGVDRLRLGAPLAVRDLVAALRFAAQPLDDLNLACLLVSPLIGWSQEDLLRHGWRERHVRLWDHLLDKAEDGAAAAVGQLRALLRLADFETPFALLHWVLVGPWQGRSRLVARLGREAGDPIDELVNAARAYAATDTPSLAGFLAWFDAGDGELKRESDGASDSVRVMTVHGSKGLQAPIVVLADAAGTPGDGRPGGITLADPLDPARRVPLPPVDRGARVGRIAEAMEADTAADMQEHWRLLYVAMTRAEEALFVGGALGSRDRGEVPEHSWYAQLHALLGPEHEAPDTIWGTRREWGTPPPPARVAAPEAEPAPAPRSPLPAWATRERPAEPRPSRPLAPSSLGEDDEAPDPPFPPGTGGDAARRGTLVHRLLERIPDVPAEDRERAAREWLASHAADLSEADRAAMLASTLAVVSHRAWADIFSPASLAEVPVAAVVGGQVVAGTIDRLVVTDDLVRVVDYKTARRPPATLAEVPRAILRQMAAYVAALEAVWPGRRVEAALLYTAAPRMIALPAEVIAARKPVFEPAQ